MPGQRFGPAWFPGSIAAGLGLCGLLLIFAGVRQGAPWVTLPDWVHHRRPLLGVGSVIAGLLFYITGIVLLTFWMRILGTSWRMAVVVALVATVAIHLSFYKVLRIPLPWGLFEQYAF